MFFFLAHLAFCTADQINVSDCKIIQQKENKTRLETNCAMHLKAQQKRSPLHHKFYFFISCERKTCRVTRSKRRSSNVYFALFKKKSFECHYATGKFPRNEKHFWRRLLSTELETMNHQGSAQLKLLSSLWQKDSRTIPLRKQVNGALGELFWLEVRTKYENVRANVRLGKSYNGKSCVRTRIFTRLSLDCFELLCFIRKLFQPLESWN